MIKKYLIFILGLCALLFPKASFGQVIKDANTEVQLVTQVPEVEPGKPFWIGLHMKMDEDWKTFWENPGDSGLATTIEWELPEGFNVSDIHWPYPERIDYPGVTVYGYGDEVMLLNKITPLDDLELETTAKFKAKVKWLSCQKICVRGQADLTLYLPVFKDSMQDEGALNTFEEAFKRLPVLKSDWSIFAIQTEDAYKLQLSPPQKFGPEMPEITFFPKRNDLIDHTAPQVLKEKDEGYEISVLKSSLGVQVDRLEGVLVSSKGWDKEDTRKALEIEIPIN